MLGQLVESSPKRVRRRFSTLVSLGAHALVLSAAVAAARPVAEAPPIDRVIPLRPPPPAPQCIECESGSAVGSRRGVDRVTYALPDRRTSEFTLDVPDRVGPPIGDIRIPGEEWERGRSAGRPVDTALVLGREFVDREAVPMSGNPIPRYPEALRAAHIEGSVSARFVVDTTGRVRMESVIVDAADHPLFANAVIEALRASRFAPAEFRGRKVPQLVAQPFVFVIRE
jgi:TonB family protein